MVFLSTAQLDFDDTSFVFELLVPPKRLQPFAALHHHQFWSISTLEPGFEEFGRIDQDIATWWWEGALFSELTTPLDWTTVYRTVR